MHQEPSPRVALVTGASSGIGAVTARELALQGYHVFLACRSEARTRAVLDDIRTRSRGAARAEFLPLDLGDLDSVRACAEAFLGRGLPLHLLVANAGLAGEKGLTRSGFELIFGVCHVGHFLLTQLLLERLTASAPARIVVVASSAHRQARGIDFAAVRRPTQTPKSLKEYPVAKLANILFATELARRLAGTGVTTYAVHPGVVATDVWRSVPWPVAAVAKRFMRSPEQGAQTSLYCATEPSVAGESGRYYADCYPQKPSRLARDAGLAGRLWEASEAWTGTAPA